MDLDLLSRLNAARSGRQAAILVTDLDSGAQRLARPDDGAGKDLLAGELATRFRSGRSGLVETPEGGKVFLTVSVPPPRIVLIGAVHISRCDGG